MRATGSEFDLLDSARKEGFKIINELITNLARTIVKEQADAEERGRTRGGGK